MGLVSWPYFVYDFPDIVSRIDKPNFIVLFPFSLEILGNTSIVIICFPVYDVISFEINFVFLIKPFFYIAKKSEQKFIS